MLFVDDGYLADVEVFSYAEVSAFGGLPTPESLTILRWSERDEHGTRWALNDPFVVEQPTV